MPHPAQLVSHPEKSFFGTSPEISVNSTSEMGGIKDQARINKIIEIFTSPFSPGQRSINFPVPKEIVHEVLKGIRERGIEPTTRTTRDSKIIVRVEAPLNKWCQSWFVRLNFSKYVIDHLIEILGDCFFPQKKMFDVVSTNQHLTPWSRLILRQPLLNPSSDRFLWNIGISCRMF